jgi:hypothetical protein
MQCRRLACLVGLAVWWAAGAAAAEERPVAVVADVAVPEAVDPALVEPLTERIIAELLRTERFAVLDRAQRDAGGAPEDPFGQARALGADRVVRARVHLIGDTRTLTLSVYDTETERLLAQSQVDFTGPDAGLLSQVAPLVELLGAPPLPAPVPQAPAIEDPALAAAPEAPAFLDAADRYRLEASSMDLATWIDVSQRTAERERTLGVWITMGGVVALAGGAALLVYSANSDDDWASDDELEGFYAGLYGYVLTAVGATGLIGGSIVWAKGERQVRHYEGVEQRARDAGLVSGGAAMAPRLNVTFRF